MIGLHEIPDPGTFMFPSHYATWAELHLSLVEEHDRNCARLTALIEKGALGHVGDRIRAADERSRNACATVLFVALAVESTLNFWGALLLGTDYFNANLERSSPYQKLSGIVAVTTHNLVEDNDDIYKALKQVVVPRNRVAHPKAQVYPPGDFVELEIGPAVETARDSVAGMKKFFELLGAILPVTVGKNVEGQA
jgi:hypothetical protein